MRRAAGGTPFDAFKWGGPFVYWVWLFFLVQPITSMFQSQPPIGLIIAVLGPAFGVVVLYLILVSVDPFNVTDQTTIQRRRILVLLSIMAALSFTGPLIGGIQWLPSMTYTSAASGAKLPVKTALRVIGVLVVLTILLGLIIHAPWTGVGQGVVVVGAVGLITSGVTRLVITVKALQQAREELARLAVYEERVRVARDLHDLLGHGLSLIAVKSELAQHLVKVSPDQALEEIHDIERVSRMALMDVREAVSGYRQRTINGELESAKAMLAAAQIDLRTNITAGSLPSKIENALAWSIREGVTNVVRHSGARQCSISITRTSDGVKCDIVNPCAVREMAASRERDCPMGNGLTGLLERIRLCDGQMNAGFTADGHYALTVTIPVQPEGADDSP